MPGALVGGSLVDSWARRGGGPVGKGLNGGSLNGGGDFDDVRIVVSGGC